MARSGRFASVSTNDIRRHAPACLIPSRLSRALLRELARHKLPAWSVEIGCDGWAQFALKFIVSHPAVTCAIRATSSVAHVRQNLGAARGVMPDEAMRKRMAAFVAAL